VSSHADLLGALPAVTVPTLVVHYAGDPFTRLSEVEQVEKATGAKDFRLRHVRHADHYGRTINPDGSAGPRTREGTDAVVAWVRERFA
jgi:pimeloyl-ACP methyl ester carboxylesterase